MDAVSPNKKKGDKCATIVHDLEEGRQLPTEKSSHNFYVTVAWEDVSVDDYDCIVVPGGRSPELLVMNDKAVGLIKKFVEKGKFVAAIGMGNWLLAATGALKVTKYRLYMAPPSYSTLQFILLATPDIAG